jgi:Spy/CpxP family protein refolding chaperone
VLALGWGLAAVSTAEPLNPKDVPAKANWVAHVDVDAMRDSLVVKNAWQKLVAAHKDAEKHVDKLRDATGMDLRSDLHGITAFGPQAGQHTGVLIVHAKFDSKLLLEKAAKAPDHKVVKYGSHDLHSWTDKHHGKPHTALGVIYQPDVLVFSDCIDQLKAAVDVLDGKSPALAGDSPLARRVPAGATVLFRAIGLAQANLGKCPFAKQLDSIRVTAGENNGQSFFRARVAVVSEEVANQMKAVVEGGKALALLRAGSDEQAKKIIDGLKISVQDKSLALQFSAPAGDIWQMIQKQAKRMAEFRAKTGRLAHPGARSPQKSGEKKPAAPAPPAGDLGARIDSFLKDLNLTDQQKAKVADLKKEYLPKFKDSWKGLGDILTAEQKKAREEAIKVAKAAGKNLKEIHEAVKQAVKLTDAQKASLKQAGEKAQSLFQEFRDKVAALLTPEQKEKAEKKLDELKKKAAGK